MPLAPPAPPLPPELLVPPEVDVPVDPPVVLVPVLPPLVVPVLVPVFVFVPEFIFPEVPMFPVLVPLEVDVPVDVPVLGLPFAEGAVAEELSVGVPFMDGEPVLPPVVELLALVSVRVSPGPGFTPIVGRKLVPEFVLLPPLSVVVPVTWAKAAKGNAPAATMEAMKSEDGVFIRQGFAEARRARVRIPPENPISFRLRVTS